MISFPDFLVGIEEGDADVNEASDVFGDLILFRNLAFPALGCKVNGMIEKVQACHEYQ